jgi:hypothetical protein
MGSSITLRPSASFVSRASETVSRNKRSSSPADISETRSKLSWFTISVQPIPSPPTSADDGTRTLS